jgi:hypothetical protein
MQFVWRKQENRKEFGWRNLFESSHLKQQDGEVRIILKKHQMKIICEVCCIELGSISRFSVVMLNMRFVKTREINTRLFYV